MSKKIIIAGPNGAGRKTFARPFLPKEAQCPRFINADLIAEGLAPFTPESAALKAGRLMLEEIADSTRHGVSFAFENTLTGLGWLGQKLDDNKRRHIIFMDRSELLDLFIANGLTLPVPADEQPPF